MNFSAIDIETANADKASICQIGLVTHENGVAVEEWRTYVDPEDYFDGINVAIHGDRTPGSEPPAMWENEHITRHSRQTRRAVFGRAIGAA